MHVTANHHGVGLCREACHHGAYIVIAIVGHNVVGGNESRHIAPRLLRQVGIDVPIVLHSLGAVYGLVDIVGTTVVGGNHKTPVAKHLVEVAEIVGGGIRRLHGVAALVNEGVNLQPILFSRSKHELPQSRCSHSRHRLGIQRRLNHRQVFQFERQAIGLQCLLKYRHVEV